MTTFAKRHITEPGLISREPSARSHRSPDALQTAQAEATQAHSPLPRPMRLSTPTFVHLAAGLSMAILWGGFAYRHAMAFGETADISYLLVCLSETIAAVLFLFRTTPVSISTDPFDWFFGIAGALLPLLFAPASWGVLPAAKIAIVLGLVMQIAGLLSLNRSFAIVAARREIKTCGMYRYVRHPLYASYLVMFSGYVLTNTTPMNLMIYLITVGFLFVRIDREEKQLVFDQAYSAYQQRVTYRLIPFVF